MAQVQIGHTPVGLGAPTYVIAEIGINHNGSIKMALELIDRAVEAGANAVKFQARDVPIVYSEADRAKSREIHRSMLENALERMDCEGVHRPVFPEPGQLDRILAHLADESVATTNGDQKYALEFGPKDWDLIRSRCKARGVSWGVSPWDGLSVYKLDGFQVDFHKVASACLTHADLLRRIRSTGKPVILSTGGSTMEQVVRAVEILGTDNLVLLQCTATYPSADGEVDMAVLSSYARKFPSVPVGYSGHEADTLASRLAVSMGACVVERHLTLDKSLPGSDQKASLEPHEFAEMVEAIRDIESRRGTRASLLPEVWASEEERKRIPEIFGSLEKRVHPREVETMSKLRRIEDF